MSERLRSNIERAQRCDRVNDTRAGDFTANTRWAALRTAVKEGISILITLEMESLSSKSRRRQGTAGRQGTRKDLRALVEAVADTAEVNIPSHPDMKGVFEIPRNDHSDRTLIATARDFAVKAEPFEARFVEFGLATTFISDLSSKALALENYMGIQNEGVGTGVNVNVSARERVRELNEALKALNVMYHNKYRNDPAVLAEWESAYHLEAAPGSRRKNQTNGDGTPPPDDGANG